MCNFCAKRKRKSASSALVFLIRSFQRITVPSDSLKHQLCTKPMFVYLPRSSPSPAKHQLVKFTCSNVSLSLIVSLVNLAHPTKHVIELPFLLSLFPTDTSLIESAPSQYIMAGEKIKGTVSFAANYPFHMTLPLYMSI